MTIRSAGSSTITTGLSSITALFSAVGSGAELADNYITGAAASSRVYRVRAEAEAAEKILVAPLDARDSAVEWLVNRRAELLDRLDTKEKQEAFNKLKAELYPVK